MNRCETCKYWEGFAPHRTTHGVCLKVLMYCDGVEALPETPACIDSNGDYGGLRTLPTFGCTMHEAKS